MPELLPRLPRLAGLSETERVLALVDVLETAPRAASTRRTWLPSTATAARASSRTRSASVRESGSRASTCSSTTCWASPTSRSASRSAGDHLESRMAPALVFDSNGLELAIGSAGATRLRTALGTVLAAILDEGLDAETAVALPRVHPTPDVIDAEPGVDEPALTLLEEQRAHGAPVGALPPLLRRRELRRPCGSSRRSAAQRRGSATSVATCRCGGTRRRAR